MVGYVDSEVARLWLGTPNPATASETGVRAHVQPATAGVSEVLFPLTQVWKASADFLSVAVCDSSAPQFRLRKHADPQRLHVRHIHIHDEN